jgi:hypothetical protein
MTRPRAVGELAENAASSSYDPWAAAEALVFIGFRFVWRQRLSDLELPRTLAERWEAQFGSWNVQPSGFELAGRQSDYFISLTNSSAAFRCESSTAFALALEHASELSAELVETHPEGAGANIDAQFLLPVPVEFPVLVERLHPKLLNPAILKTVEAVMEDLAYLADVQIDGRWHQINAGPVRAEEIPRRVAAISLKSTPPVAIYASVSCRGAYKYQVSDLAHAVRRTVRIGDSIVKELAT